MTKLRIEIDFDNKEVDIDWGGPEKPVLVFYDVRTRSKFTTNNWYILKEEEEDNTRYFAIAETPDGKHEVWRVVSKDFGEKYADL